jgi:E3 ubiquitin-protein ligase HUWE1
MLFNRFLDTNQTEIMWDILMSIDTCTEAKPSSRHHVPLFAIAETNRPIREAVAEFLIVARRVSLEGYITVDEANAFHRAAAVAVRACSTVFFDGWSRQSWNPRSSQGTSLVLRVSRDNVLDHAIQWFNEHEGSEIESGRLQIQFLREFGSDSGGLRREWYTKLAREILESGFLIETEANARRYMPRTVGDNVMEFVGKFVAKAVKDRETIVIRFARVALRYILEGLDSVELSLEMFRDDYPEHATALKWMLDNESSEAIRDLTFSLNIIAGGVRRVLELIEGGAGIPVTADNKVEYVNHVIEYKMRLSIRPQLESFLVGFHSVIPRDALGDLVTSVDELDLRIAGSPVIDISDLRAHTRYSGYLEVEIQITWFWEVVESFSQEELSLLVMFTSGTPVAPVGGFAILPFNIARVGLNVDPARNPLPSAHTCFNQLDLPAYTSKGELREKLILSITRGNEGFGFA